MTIVTDSHRPSFLFAVSKLEPQFHFAFLWQLHSWVWDAHMQQLWENQKNCPIHWWPTAGLTCSAFDSTRMTLIHWYEPTSSRMIRYPRELVDEPQHTVCKYAKPTRKQNVRPQIGRKHRVVYCADVGLQLALILIQKTSGDLLLTNEKANVDWSDDESVFDSRLMKMTVRCGQHVNGEEQKGERFLQTCSLILI
jgi:hypothetical protein